MEEVSLIFRLGGKQNDLDYAIHEKDATQARSL